MPRIFCFSYNQKENNVKNPTIKPTSKLQIENNGSSNTKNINVGKNPARNPIKKNLNPLLFFIFIIFLKKS